MPTLKEIRANAYASDYKGYLADDIQAIGRKSEPQRTQCINALRKKVLDALNRDISVFRRCVRELRQYRRNHPEPVGRACAEIHTSMSLKHSHIYNGFANLKTLDELPDQQVDLFG